MRAPSPLYSILLLTPLGCHGSKDADESLGETEGEGDPPVDAVGWTWALALNGSNLGQPDSVETLLMSFFDHYVMVQVYDADASGLKMIVGMTVDGEGQDYCATTNLISAEWSGPTSFQGGDFEVSLLGGGTGSMLPVMHISTFSASFEPDGSATMDGQLEGMIDFRTAGNEELVTWVGCDAGDIACVCDVVDVTRNQTCEPCSDGTVACLAIEISEIPGFNMAPYGEMLTIAEPNCNEACALSQSNPDCDTSNW